MTWFQLGWLLFLAVIVVGASLWNLFRGLRRITVESKHFEGSFGGSVDRMLADAVIDRDVVRRLRSVGRSGAVRAARYVRKTLGVPFGPALEFARRV